VAPLVLGVVLVVLNILLRSLVAPLMLVLTVVGTYFAAMGAGNLLFTDVLGYPGLDIPVPLLAFLFLVALGVDYNIFLATRAREEALVRGSRRGMLTALAVTGGVITSAGILLAAVFAVLGVLPLVALTSSVSSSDSAFSSTPCWSAPCSYPRSQSSSVHVSGGPVASPAQLSPPGRERSTNRNP
jgi:uncharacterized membrane protein YdfJ with MMPL/SSD domain